jgi:very-short-patch-repair endonuclease
LLPGLVAAGLPGLVAAIGCGPAGRAAPELRFPLFPPEPVEADMPWIPSSLARHFAAHHGVASLDTLLRHGVSVHQVRRLTAAGLLERMHRGVYRSTSNERTFEARCAAASAAHGPLVVSGPSAARLWGLRRSPAVAAVTAVVPREHPCRLDGVLIRQSTTLAENDVVPRVDGIRLASPLRTWFDLAGWPGMTDGALESMLEHLLDGWCSIVTIRDFQRRWARPGRPGVAQVNRVLGSRPDDVPAAESGLELRVLAALATRGVVLQRQHRLTLPDGRRVRLDGADPLVRWGVEIDHHTWHAPRDAATADKQRDRMLRLLGWQIDRVTDDELARNFTGVVDQLEALYRARVRGFLAGRTGDGGPGAVS